MPATDPVYVVDYNPEWPRLFEQARAELAPAFGHWAHAILHVGSTSVPGLAAKPIIDIAVVTAHYPLPDAVIAAVCALGYEHKGEFGIPRRHYFKRGAPQTHHLHVLERDNEDLARLLLFRDYLRAHPQDAARYETLKRELAARYRYQRETYTASKTALVHELVERARAWRALHSEPRR